MTEGLRIAREWRAEDGTTSRLAEMINDAIADARADEREACAKVADEIECEEAAAFIVGDVELAVKRSIAAAIRARSK